MYELIFSYKEGSLVVEGKYGKRNEKIRSIQVDDKKALELIEELEKKYKSKIKNICFDGKDLTFTVDKIKIRLSNRTEFIKDPRFKFIFEYINQKRYKKSDNNIVKKAIVITLSVAIAITGVVVGIKSIKKGKEEPDPVEPTTSSTISDDNSTSLEDLDGYGSLVNSEKAKETRRLYGDTIEKYCNMYGLDSNVLCAIATQERGIHSNKVDDGGAIGLFQVQVSVWNNEDITVYNEEKDTYETIHITLEELCDVDFNIKVGCAIFKRYFNIMQGNYYATMMCYNMGEGTARKIIRQYAKDTNRTFDEVLADLSDLGWLKYTENYNGDPDYVKHVTRYIEEGRIKV